MGAQSVYSGKYKNAYLSEKNDKGKVTIKIKDINII